MISFVRKCISLAFSFKKHELDFESDSNESISEEHENTTGMILIMKIKMKTIYLITFIILVPLAFKKCECLTPLIQLWVSLTLEATSIAQKNIYRN
jgi:hypothetical protein